jgi:hypothetical protein
MSRAARRRAIAAVPLALAALAGVPAAHAATITYDGDTLVYTAAAGERNDMILGPSAAYGQAIQLGDSAPVSFPDGSCVQGDGWLHCAAPAAVRIDLGDNNDTFAFASGGAPLPNAVSVAGGPGADTLRGLEQGTGPTLDGGPGDAVLEGKGAGETLQGGDGNDTLTGRGGADRLFGGPGDDTLDGDRYDAAAPDLLDGGPGVDKVEGWANPAADRNGPITVTVDGVADDGRAGEGDDVRDVEQIESHVSGRFAFTDAPDVVDVWANLDQGPSTIATAGGADRVIGGNAAETIDAGPGDDRVEGGFGDDAITGGPGKDTIYGDKVGSNCGLFESCDIPVGNDTINARDGEVDTIDCGVGTDRAVVDAVDVVAASCEAVDRGAVAGVPQPGAAPAAPGAAAPGTTGRGSARKARIALARVTAGDLRRRGLQVRITGARRGTATLVARVRGRKVGSARVRIGAAGTARATIRLSAAGRRLVRRGVTLKVTGAGATLTAKVR